MLQCKTNARLRNPITVRSTSSGFIKKLDYSFFQLFEFHSLFSLFLSSFCHLIISSVPTCLVHNCETFWSWFYFYLLSPLSCDQILFDLHHQHQSWLKKRCQEETSQVERKLLGHARTLVGDETTHTISLKHNPMSYNDAIACLDTKFWKKVIVRGQPEIA